MHDVAVSRLQRPHYGSLPPLATSRLLTPGFRAMRRMSGEGQVGADVLMHCYHGVGWRNAHLHQLVAALQAAALDTKGQVLVIVRPPPVRGF